MKNEQPHPINPRSNGLTVGPPGRRAMAPARAPSAVFAIGLVWSRLRLAPPLRAEGHRLPATRLRHWRRAGRRPCTRVRVRAVSYSPVRDQDLRKTLRVLGGPKKPRGTMCGRAHSLYPHALRLIATHRVPHLASRTGVGRGEMIRRCE
jgi:hypothetical protein